MFSIYEEYLNATEICLNSSNVSPTSDVLISFTNEEFRLAKLLGVIYPPTAVSSPAGPPIRGGKPPLSPKRISSLI